MHDPAIPERQRVTDDMGGRRTPGLVLVLIVVLIGVAIAKPWGSPGEPTPSVAPAQSDATPLPSSLPTSAPETSSAAPSADVGPLPVAFTTPLPPTSAAWTGLRWRRLAPDDPLSLVTSVLRWSRGFIATGWIAGPPTSTPVWTSADGTHWDPLISGTSTTFWPGLAVVGLAELRTGLVAVTESVPYCGGPCSPRYVLPIVSWTSADGRGWTASLLLPVAWLANPSGSAPLFSLGPAGLVVATSGPSAHLATSTDGSHWNVLPAAAFPARFALNDLHGTATGYVAVGRLMTTDGSREAASLWSSDGRHWSEVPTILPTSSTSASDVGSAVATLVVGRNGIIAVGRIVTTPGTALWWQSPDGRRWQPLRTFAPLGPTACTGDGCSVQPNGALVGDGNRMVAVRGGAEGGAWTSADGLTWSRLRQTGDLPGERATRAALLPRGVLLSDGTITWLGEAQVP